MSDVIMKWNDKEFLILATKEATEATKRAAITVQRKAKFLTSMPGTGPNVYKRGKKRHRASSPYQPPARDYGTLTSSIDYEVHKKGILVEGFVGPDIDKIKQGLSKSGRKVNSTTVEYGLYLELGHKNRGGMSSSLPRPFLRPALRSSEREVLNIFKKAFE